MLRKFIALISVKHFNIYNLDELTCKQLDLKGETEPISYQGESVAFSKDKIICYGGTPTKISKIKLEADIRIYDLSIKIIYI
jgi:hypothetical protein